MELTLIVKTIYQTALDFPEVIDVGLQLSPDIEIRLMAKLGHPLYTKLLSLKIGDEYKIIL